MGPPVCALQGCTRRCDNVDDTFCHDHEIDFETETDEWLEPLRPEND